MKKRILVYGDSNVYGQMAYYGRYPEYKQWCWLLENKLGASYRIIQEGLCARIAGNFETQDRIRNGQDYFEIALLSALPVDIVIVSLGVNDLKNRYDRKAKDIADDLLWYDQKLDLIRDTMMPVKPTIIYLAPTNFTNNRDYFDASESKRRRVIDILEADTANTVVLNDIRLSEDGVHYSEDAHKVVASSIYDKIKELNL